MNLPASVFRGHLSLASPFACRPCHHLRSCRIVAAAVDAMGASKGRCFLRNCRLLLRPTPRLRFLSRHRVVCQAVTETGPENQDEKENEAANDAQSSISVNGEEQENRESDSQSTVEQNNDEPVITYFPSPIEAVENNKDDLVPQGNDECALVICQSAKK